MPPKQSARKESTPTASPKKALAVTTPAKLKQVRKADVDPEVPILPDGTVYHLACTRDQLADRIILVGDPGRVPFVAEWFDKDSVTFDGTHREIRIITGTYKGTPISALSTGMGTDNCEIVINEIHTLKEFDIATGKWAKNPADIAMIRVGTCGCPNPDLRVGTLAVTRHAIGMDNTCRYYKRGKRGANEVALQKALESTDLHKNVGTYTAKATPEVTAALVDAVAALNKTRKASEQRPHAVGTTASGSGFYGCQGRAVGRFRGSLAVPDLVDELGSIKFKSEGGNEERVVNIEMENSCICYLSEMLGYKAGTVCAIIATRAGDHREFASPELGKQTISDGIQVALDAVTSL